jgi:SAM-dependent methyltransferase
MPSLREVENFLQSLDIVSDDVDGDILTTQPGELDDYVETHTYRLWRSLEILSANLGMTQPTRILELGSMPYYFSALLRYFYPQVELVGVNVRADPLGGDRNTNGKVRKVELHSRTFSENLQFEIRIMNIERDAFPFDTDSYDAVLCMEVIEHLIYSPSHMLTEAHRVLKPDGLFFLSTPNAVDLRKTLLQILNRPTGFPYSGYGVYGRHNREYTLSELITLTEACSYEIERGWLENIAFREFNSLPRRFLYGLHNLITSLPLGYFKNKRQYCYILARATGDPRCAFPEELYLFRQLYPGESSK